MPALQSAKSSVAARTLQPPTMPVCPDTSLFHRSHISFTRSSKYFPPFNK